MPLVSPATRLVASEERPTTTTTTELGPGYLDVTRLAVVSFLARYREPTLTAYTQDLKVFLGWCQTYDREALRVSRGELESYVRHLEGRGYAAATVARRFGTVATFYNYAVIDGVIPANPAAAVSRPKVAREGRSAPCCTRWSSPPCSHRPVSTAAWEHPSNRSPSGHVAGVNPRMGGWPYLQGEGRVGRQPKQFLAGCVR